MRATPQHSAPPYERGTRTHRRPHGGGHRPTSSRPTADHRGWGGGSAAGTFSCCARGRGRTTACASWMHGRCAGGMSWRSCANRLRMVSYTDNLPHVIDLTVLAVLAERVTRVQTTAAA